MHPDIVLFSSDFALDQTNPRHWPLIFSWVPANDENFSYVVYFLTGGHYNCKFPAPSSPYELSACGRYLESAILSLADISSSLSDADPVVPDPLPPSALIDMSGQTNIATDALIAAPTSLVSIVPSAPVSPASNALVLATYATHPRPLSYVVIALCTVSLQ